MKKIYGLLLAICILVVFTSGCSKYELNEQEQSSKYENYTYDQEKSQLSYGRSHMAVSEKGYYYNLDSILYFYNINSNVNMPLCSKSNCKHNDNSCDAYISNVNAYLGKFDCTCMDYKIMYYNNHLYCIEATKDREYYLMQYDEGFGNKEKMLTLASVKDDLWAVIEANACLISNGYLYYYTSYIDPDYVKNGYMTIFRCNRVKLEESAKVENIGEFKYPGDYAMKAGDPHGLGIYMSGGNIYFYAGGTSRMYNYENPVQFRVYKYEPSSGKLSNIWDYTGYSKANVIGENTGVVNYKAGGQYVTMDDNGNFYFINGNNKTIVKASFENSTAKVIYITPKEDIETVFSDGKHLYVVETQRASKGYSCISVIDTDGSVISCYEFKYDDKYIDEISKYGGNIDNRKPSLTDNFVLYGIDERMVIMGTSFGGNGFKGLTSIDMLKMNANNTDDLSKISGVGFLDTGKLISGENDDIKQIYKY